MLYRMTWLRKRLELLQVGRFVRRRGEFQPNDILNCQYLTIWLLFHLQLRWVLDGYPYTKEQTLQLEKSGVLPHMILHLELDYKTVMARCAEDFATSQQYVLFHPSPPSQPHNSPTSSHRAHTPTPSIPPLIQTHHTLYKTNIEDIKKMYETTYGNWTDMDARKSKWALKSLVGRVVRGNVERRQGHLGAVATGLGFAFVFLHEG